eukprot:TRINITY_DN7902_c0_g1_i3.p1 TRINITY_DN7902_c0_g1~~TRINITY_DN7902_c0_g1_i3.p1  ORF type:complete len:178 (-),score=11.11 TRINITY_DN7902_c0_g1_i3:143-676(-)
MPLSPCHPLTSITVEYANTFTGRISVLQKVIKVSRPQYDQVASYPIVLDTQINRYAAGVAITEAIELCNKNNFEEAQRKLGSLIFRIMKSASATELYCRDLIQDLQDCLTGMKDSSSFKSGVHLAHSLSVMYFMERCNGQILSFTKNHGRSKGYGHITETQRHESEEASKYVSSYYN